MSSVATPDTLSTASSVESKLLGDDAGTDADIYDEISSTVSSVAESLSMVQSICGVNVTNEFLSQLDIVLREQLLRYRIITERQQEVVRVANAQKVRQMAEQYQQNPVPLPSQMSRQRGAVRPASASSAIPAAPAATPSSSSSAAPAAPGNTFQSPAVSAALVAPAVDPSPEYTEIRSLRRRGLVSTMCSAFRGRLESIVGTQATEPPGTAPRSRVGPSFPATAASTMSSPTTAPSLSPHVRSAPSAPPAPPVYTTANNNNNNAYTTNTTNTFRAPDSAFTDQLLPSQASFSTDETSAQELFSLMQFQVASRVLSSQFRTRLETMLNEHIVRRNITPNNIRLPRSTRPPPPAFSAPPHPHHHLSQSLGAPPPPPPSLASQMPAVSESAPMTSTMMAAMPTMQGSSRDSTLWQLSQEMSVFRLQMQEMRRMVDTSLQLQLEMQRSLRQEVSALFEVVRFSQATLAIPAPAEVKPDTVSSVGKCVVCVEKPADVVFFRCGHQCACITCASLCKSQNKTCPICRAPIQDFVRCFPAW